MTLPDAHHGPNAPADVYRAEGVLAARLGLDLAAAAEVLRDEAAARAVTPLQVAREVLAGPSRCTAVLDPWGSC
jgi:hypothetical protein